MAPLQPPPAAALPPANPWRVYLLGGFALDDGQQRLERLRSRAAMALLARLALQPGREHAREELATLLWPEADAATGRSRLRQTLSLLKAVLEPPGAPPVLLADRRTLRAAPQALWCDALAFQQALRAGQHEEARRLYRGELLPGFYDEWVHDERQRLHALAEALDTLPAAPAAPTPQAAAPATPATLAAPPSPRLPQYLTRLIDADQRRARLQAHCSAQRLVTVLGPGGSGKTRLALEVARGLSEGAAEGRAAPRFERAIFVPLVGAFTAPQLLDRLLQALRIGTAGSPAEQVVALLQGRPLLVLLDNCEQLDDGAVASIAQLAESLPGVHWLATSRRLLGLDGEHEFPLAGLALPAEDATLEAVAQNPAVLLFIDRARAHRPDFHLHAGNRAGLVGLVRWLEGLPLAIELAASRARGLSPAEMLALLQAPAGGTGGAGGAGTAGLAWLSRRGPRSGGDSRHASMLAVVEWSWQLLGDAQRQMLTALCQLPAGATLAAATALHGAGALPPLQAQQLLDELQGHSVLKTGTGQDGATRWQPYEPVREYVLAQLPADEARAWRARVLRWWLQWAQTLPATPPLASVRDELPNLTAVLAQAGDDGQADEALRLVVTLQSAWGEIAIPGAALVALGRLLQQPGLDVSLAAAGHALAATFSQAVGQADSARQHLARALAQPVPEPTLRCMVLSRGARLVWRLDADAPRTRAMIEEALPLARELGRHSTEASLLSLQGHLTSVVERNPAAAQALIAQSAALWQRSGNAHLINAGRFNLAYNLLATRQPTQALQALRALAEEGLALQDWDLAAGALDACGVALRMRRQWQAAADAHGQALQVAWDNAETLSVIYALWNIPPSLLRLGQPLLAARTMAAAAALWAARFGQHAPNSDLRELERVRRQLQRLLPPAELAAAWQAGSRLGMAEAVHAVLAWHRASGLQAFRP